MIGEVKLSFLREICPTARGKDTLVKTVAAAPASDHRQKIWRPWSGRAAPSRKKLQNGSWERFFHSKNKRLTWGLTWSVTHSQQFLSQICWDTEMMPQNLISSIFHPWSCLYYTFATNIIKITLRNWTFLGCFLAVFRCLQLQGQASQTKPFE